MKKTICPPDNVVGEQLIHIVTKYLQENPKKFAYGWIKILQSYGNMHFVAEYPKRGVKTVTVVAY